MSEDINLRYTLHLYKQRNIALRTLNLPWCYRFVNARRLQFEFCNCTWRMSLKSSKTVIFDTFLVMSTAAVLLYYSLCLDLILYWLCWFSLHLFMKPWRYWLHPATYPPTHTYIQTHTHTDTPTHPHTHTDIHTYTHTVYTSFILTMTTSAAVKVKWHSWIQAHLRKWMIAKSTLWNSIIYMSQCPVHHSFLLVFYFFSTSIFFL